MNCGLVKDVKLQVGQRTFNVRACVASGAWRTSVSQAAARRLGIGPQGRVANVALTRGGCARQQRILVSNATTGRYDADLVVGLHFLRGTNALIIIGRGGDEVLCGAHRKGR